jgi:putative transposase
MTYRKVPFVLGEYFHVYNRGNSKQPIFLDDQDKDRFIKLLFIQNTHKGVRFRDDIIKAQISAWDFDKGENIVSVGAWVIMPNHFHLYLHSPNSSPNPGLGLEEVELKQKSISVFMNKLCSSYSKYFNKKYDRTGSLFEGRFKAVHIDDDIQAKYLFSYIHLNPIKLIDSKWKEEGIKDKEKALEFLKNYKWSSYLDYKGINRKESKILERENFINYFPDNFSFDKEIFEWLNFKK